MMLLPTMRGVGARRSKASAQYVTSGWIEPSPYTITSTKLATGPAQVGDMLFIFLPFGGSVANVSGGGAWTTSSYTWPSLAYVTSGRWKIMTSADLTNTHTVSSISYGPVSWAVYRGPTTAALVYSNEAGPSVNSTYHDIALPAQHANHLGYVHYITDRDGTVIGSPPAGYTARTSTATGVFTGQVGDRLTGNPTGSHTARWSGFEPAYAQAALAFELRS